MIEVIDLTDERPSRATTMMEQMHLAARTTVGGYVVPPNCGVCLANLSRFCRQADRNRLLRDIILPVHRKQVFDFGYVTLAEYTRLLFGSQPLYVEPGAVPSAAFTDACRFVQDALFTWTDTTQADRLEAIRKLCPYRARVGKHHLHYAPAFYDPCVEIVLVNTRNPHEANVNDHFVAVVQFSDNSRMFPIFRSIINPPL